MSKSIWTLFDEQAQRHPSAIAVHDDGRHHRYAEVRDAAIEFADWLDSSGTQRSDRVALIMPNCAEYVWNYLGILKAGRVVVGLNPDMAVEELKVILEDCTPSVVVLGGKAKRFHESIRRLSETIAAPQFILTTAAEDEIQPLLEKPTNGAEQPGSDNHRRGLAREFRDLAQIIYTSGTTGRPKGVMLSHRNLTANCNSIVDYLSLNSRDSVLVVLPFHYSYGNSLLITHLAVGARLVLAKDFVFWNRVLDLMEQQQVSGFAGVPSTFALILFRSDVAQRRFPHLRYMTCAGGGLLPAHVESVRKIFPESQLFLMYGQTEATARLSYLPWEYAHTKVGSIGIAIPGGKFWLEDENKNVIKKNDSIGELVYQGDNVTMGYAESCFDLQNDDENNGILHTGDLAKMDPDGFYYITGRMKRFLKMYGNR
ncbi:MAG: AMP-binding protein, partial [Planctomycetaceae bacterium]